jgi:hypothetical protein
MRAYTGLILCLLLAGCAGNPLIETPAVNSREQLIEGVNARSAPIESLWTAGNFELWLVNDGRTEYLNGSLNLLYLRPGRVMLVGSKAGAGRIFEMGVNQTHYWFTAYHDVNTTWFGRLDATPRPDATLQARPDAIVSVLGLDPIDPSQPGLEFDESKEGYRLRFGSERAVWYDRKTLDPKRIEVFDASAQVLVEAEVSKRKRVEFTPGGSVMSEYHLRFPATGSRMILRLNDPQPRRGNVPSPTTFRFDPIRVRSAEVVDLDAKP